MYKRIPDLKVGWTLFISVSTSSSREECTWCSCSTGTRHPFPSFWCASSKLSPWRGSTECGILCAMWSSWLTGPSTGFGSCRGSLSLLPFWRYVCYVPSCNITECYHNYCSSYSLQLFYTTRKLPTMVFGIPSGLLLSDGWAAYRPCCVFQHMPCIS